MPPTINLPIGWNARSTPRIEGTVLDSTGLVRAVQLEVDTGSASTVSLDSGTAAQVRPRGLDAPAVKVTSWSGETRSRGVTLESLRLASLTIDCLAGVARRGDDAGGNLLGWGLCKEFGGVLFDWNRGELVVFREEPGEESPRLLECAREWDRVALERWEGGEILETPGFGDLGSARAWLANQSLAEPADLSEQFARASGGRVHLRYRFSSNLPCVRGRVHGREALLLLDTGGEGELLVLGGRDLVPGRAREVRVWGLGGTVRAWEPSEPWMVSLGTRDELARAILVEGHAEAPPESADPVRAIVGVELLRRRALLFRPGSGEVWFARP